MPKTPLIISLEGDLDIAKRETVDWQFKPALFADRVVIDLTNVQFIDSSALTLILRLRKARIEKQYQPELYVVPNPHVRKILSITHLGVLPQIYETLDEALTELNDVPDLPA